MFNFGKNKKNNVGKIGERLAGKYLKKNGYKIIEFNFQNDKGKCLGEIDIVARVKKKTGKNNKLVFVEVKTRINNNKNKVILPEENITRQKMYKLQKIAQVYIENNNLWDFDYGFDAVTVLLSSDYRSVKIKHFEDIFF